MALERENTALETWQGSEQSAATLAQKNGGFISSITKHVRGIATACLGLLGAGEIGCASVFEYIDNNYSTKRKQGHACDRIDVMTGKTYRPDDPDAKYRVGNYGIDGIIAKSGQFDLSTLKQVCKQNQKTPRLLQDNMKICNNIETLLQAFELLGIIAENCGDENVALVHYNQAIDLAEKNNLHSSPIVNVLRRSIMRVESRKQSCRDVEKASTAMKTIPENKLTEAIEQCGDDFIRLKTYMDLGDLYAERNPFLAEEFYKKAIDTINKIRQKINIDPRSCSTYNIELWETPGDLGQLYYHYGGVVDEDKRIYCNANWSAEKQLSELKQKIYAQKKTEELRSGPEVRELFENIRMARVAEGRENYDEAFRYYSLAQQSGNQVVAAYKEAGVKIPRDIDVFGIEIGEGRYRNGQRIGINTGQPEPSRGEVDTATAIGEGLKFLGAVAIQEAPAIFRAALKTTIFICKNFPGACSPKTPATTYGNGEIEVGVGITSCTDDGIAVKLPYKQETKCTTFTGPSCVIPNLQPGEYEVYAHRLGHCKEQKVGPVKVIVEPNEKIYIDFSRDLE